MRRGLLEACALFALGLVGALAGAGVWGLVGDGDFRRHLGVLAIVVALLLTLTGGGLQMGRDSTHDGRAFLGVGPERENATGGKGLTALGIFLFVGIPLLVTGLLLMA
ncbi:MAG: hypothetical protein JWO79_1365 [Actinomycetia bacterium]|nr:hypothetical protein [Actinomycetes bacterium]